MTQNNTKQKDNIKQNTQPNNNNTKQQKITQYTNSYNNTNNTTTTTTTNNIQPTNTRKQNNKSTKKNYITFAAWNCRKGILQNDNQPGDKLAELEEYIQTNKIDVITINEADLHGANSRTTRTSPITEDEI